jgi:hypothetical protein
MCYAFLIKSEKKGDEIAFHRVMSDDDYMKSIYLRTQEPLKWIFWSLRSRRPEVDANSEVHDLFDNLEIQTKPAILLN